MLALALTATRDARACWCSPSPACKALSTADSVFVGTALKVTQLSEGRWKTLFAVRNGFKGVTTVEVEVTSQENSFECPVPHFQEGQDYLVYASRDRQGELAVGGCNPSVPMTLGFADVNYLRAQAGGAAPTSVVYGVVMRLDAKDLVAHGDPLPLPATTVQLDGASKRLETQTDASGYFEFKGLPPGSYTVAPQLPDTLIAPTSKVSLGTDGCAVARFLALWNGRISGRAVGADGRPIADADVSLIALGQPRGESIAERTDSEGRYTFDAVPPGRYRVGLLDGAVDVPSEKYPFPPQFYPGTSTLESGNIIDLGQGQKFDSADFNVPRFDTRTIRVEVRWPDGRPAVGVEVDIEYEQSYCWRQRCSIGGWIADQRGRVVLPAYGDGEVRVYAQGKNAAGEPCTSEVKELGLRELPLAATLVMTGPDTEKK